MPALAAGRPACVQGRQQVLLIQVFQYAGHAGAQVVVEQNGAGVKVFEAQAALAAHHGLQRHGIAAGQVKYRGFLNFGVDGANAHVQTGHIENTAQLGHIAQVKSVAGVVFRNQQQVAGFGANFFNGRHGRLNGQRQHFGRQVVPTTGVKVGVHRCKLEAGIANVHRRIKRRGVLHPLQPKPALNGGHGVQNALLQLVDRALHCGDQMGNHGGTLLCCVYVNGARVSGSRISFEYRLDPAPRI